MLPVAPVVPEPGLVPLDSMGAPAPLVPVSRPALPGTVPGLVPVLLPPVLLPPVLLPPVLPLPEPMVPVFAPGATPGAGLEGAVSAPTLLAPG
jgi:hypothetical protein